MSNKTKTKKIYYASRTINVVFQSEYDLTNDNRYSLQREAINYISLEMKNIGTYHTDIKQLTSFKEVPDEWKDCLIYGTKEEISCRDVFAKTDKDFQEYLRLKEIYEPED